MQNFSKQFLTIVLSCSLMFNGVGFASEEQKQGSYEYYRAIVEECIRAYPIEFASGSLVTLLTTLIASGLLLRSKNKIIDNNNEKLNAQANRFQEALLSITKQSSVKEIRDAVVTLLTVFSEQENFMNDELLRLITNFINSIKEILSHNEQSIDAINNKLRELRELKQELTGGNKKLKASIAKINRDINIQKGELDRLDEEVTNLKSKKAKVEEINSLLENNSVTEIEELIAQKEEELESVNLKLEQKQSTINQLEESLASKSEELTTIKSSLKELTDQKEQVKQEKKNILSEIGDINRFINDHNNLLRESEQLQLLDQELVTHHEKDILSDSNIQDLMTSFASTSAPSKEGGVLFGKLSFKDETVICSSIYNTVNKSIQDMDRYTTVTYAHSSLHENQINQLQCDYIIVPVIDQELCDLETIQEKLDIYAENRQQLPKYRGSVLKIIYMLDANEINFEQRLGILDLFAKDSFNKKCLATISAFGSENTQYAVNMIKALNGFNGSEYLYSKRSNIVSPLDATLMIYGADVSCVKELLTEVEYTFRTGGYFTEEKKVKIRQIGTIGNFYTKQGIGTHKIAEGQESPVKYLDFAVGENKEGFLDTSSLILRGLETFTDHIRFVLAAPGVRTNYRYQYVVNEEGNITNRYITYRDLSKDKSMNMYPLTADALWKVSQQLFERDHTRRYQDLLSQQNFIGDMSEYNYSQQIINEGYQLGEFLKNQLGNGTYQFLQYSGISSYWDNLPRLQAAVEYFNGPTDGSNQIEFVN